MELSIVIPVYNERDVVAATVRSVTEAVALSRRFVASEIVVADDGSTDGSGDAALAAATDVPVRVARLARNRGRFDARKHGLEQARGRYVLFIDAGVTVTERSLAYLGDRLERDGADVWNAHTIMPVEGNPYGRFWRVVGALAFADYLEQPRETSFDTSNFDRFPKGTTCFFAPRDLLLDAFASFRSKYADSRHANDDTPIIRSIAERRPIHISPDFACVYVPRGSLRSFVKHALHRGVVFVDGHGRGESRFFPLVVAFFPLSVLAAAGVARRPALAPVLAISCSAAAAAVALRRAAPREDVVAFAALAPVYAAAHGAGMWRGLALAVAARLGARR